jgi:predicted enzyme related to lactoylglutathione lyase
VRLLPIPIRHRPRNMRALFTSFAASDYELSKLFYEKAVGLEIQREYEGKPHRFTNYDLGGIVLKLYEWKDEYYGSGHSGLFIETDDLDSVIERIRHFGAKTTEIEVHEWGGRCCSVTDPFGNIFDLIDADQKGDA